MKLLKIHREALLDQLEETNKQLDSRTMCINNQKGKDKQRAYYTVISVILLEHTQSIIKQALINNEIEEV